MDDGNQTVGAGAEAGATGTPSQSVSPPVQTPIPGDVSQLLTGLEGKFSEQFTNLQKELRGLQGRQDKSDNTFRQQLAKLNQYKSEGMSDDDALKEMELDDAEAAWRQRLEQKLEDLAGRITGIGTQVNGQQQVVANVFSTIGLDLKDPRVAVALTKQYKDQDAIELAAWRLKSETASPQSTSAQAASLSGGSSQSGLTPQQVEQKSAELARLMDNYSKNEPQINTISKELEAYWAKQ